GHDAYYFEFTSDWPYDPVRQMKVDDSDYAVPYLARVADGFGLAGRWAYRRSYSDNEWFGLTRARAEQLLAGADAVFNVAGATRRSKEQLDTGRWIYLGTDPVLHEIAYAEGDPIVRTLIDEHDATVTYGENIGTPRSPVPPLPRLCAHMRQPVLLDMWSEMQASRDVFSTVTNWQQVGLDIEFRGEMYRWSKHHEFLKFVELPRRTSQLIELAMNLAGRKPIRPDDNEAVPAVGIATNARELLESNGWLLADAPSFSMDPWRYRDYVLSSRGEFTVARDLNVRLRSGWFSERSACYLAAGRPVVTQDTGFGDNLPTGEGLFAFTTMDEIVASIDAINGDYTRHCDAARSLAREYFDAERVLSRLLQELGF
ncbi:MAG: hypothetical protein OEZ08_08205, partial [Betaproteobacteria bacterium]|nr:hypothetical protein [Betaproteobacteria bacterium]